MTDEHQTVAPLFIDGRYLLATRQGTVEIVPSGPKRRRHPRWWRAVLGDEVLTDWLATPRIVHRALSRRGF